MRAEKDFFRAEATALALPRFASGFVRDLRSRLRLVRQLLREGLHLLAGRLKFLSTLRGPLNEFRQPCGGR